MNRNIFLKFIVCIAFNLQNAQSAVYKIDLTVWQNNRFVDLTTTDEEQYRGYVSAADKDGTTFNIGRTSYTGTGDVGQEVVNPNGGSTTPDNSGFPPGSRVGYNTKGYKRINIFLQGSNKMKERIGAFYVKAIDNTNQILQMTTIKTAKDATITSLHETLSASVGDQIILEVTSTVSNLRWLHNGNQTSDTWNGETSVTIENVRKGDEGIYECYEDGHQTDGVHAIMRLIVRACPAGKYGSQCEIECPTCYNGGVCQEDTGICICTAGFMGDNCETDCGSNKFGAECSITCSSSGGNCKTQYLCVPDPGGCSCVAGYTGNDCNEECATGLYGSSCQHTCHCSDSDCDPATGCRANTCIDGYAGYQCQVPPSCSGSVFGELCNYKCHCQGGTDCDRNTGVCNNGQCDDGWGGADCQQALPSFYNKPSVSIEGTTAAIQWNAWDQKIDYGTGPIEKYQVYYAEQGESLVLFGESTNTEVEIPDLSHETYYDFGITVVRQIGGVPWEGITGPVENSITGCGVPTNSPTITQVLVQGPASLQVHWTVPTGADWIKCSAGIAAFIIQYDSIQLHVEDSAAREMLIEDLNSCTKYDFSIRIRNVDYKGPNSSSVQATTAPSKVTSLDTTPTYDSLYLTWNKPSDCTIDNYMVLHQLTNLHQCLPVQTQPTNEITSTTSITITGLESHSTYAISVYAVVDSVAGEQESIDAVTDETVPSGTPSNVTNDTSVKKQITFRWDLPPCDSRNGAITKFEYAFGRDLESGDVTLGSTEPNIKSQTFPNLDHYVLYQFKIRANTSAGAGPYTDIIEVRTTESSPDSPPENVEVDDTVEAQLTFNWQLPPEDGRNGEIILYEFSFNDYLESEAMEWINDTTTGTQALFHNLPHFSQFQFRVRAMTTAGSGPFSEPIIARTPPSAPSVVRSLVVSNNFTNEIELSWMRPSELNGILSEYVITGNSGGTEYVTNMAAGQDETVTGNLTDLQPDSQYFIYVQGVTDGGGAGPISNEVIGRTLKEENGNPGPNDTLTIAVSVSVSLIFLLIVVVLIVGLIMKRRTDDGKGANSATAMSDSTNINIAFEDNEEPLGETSDDEFERSKPRAIVKPVPVVKLSKDQPIRVDDFIEYVKTKKYGAPDHELLFDYKALPDKQQSDWTVAKKSENTKKNRYINIITYDNARVHLEPLAGDPHSDYINASYIDGYKQPKAYIAAQGPNQVTVKDMWRMIWQEKSLTILMATKLVEGPKKKCEKYWPNKSKSCLYGDIIVLNESEEVHEDYTIRTFVVKNQHDHGDADRRVIKQFHFTGWPDMQAPEFAGPVLEMLQKVNDYNPSNAGPVVIHCSAGVGRTGTFITIDSMLKMARAEGKVDVFNFVRQMRTKRVKMVQTEEQYEFIHDALLEALFCKNTTIPTAGMEQACSRMEKDKKWLAGQHRALDAMFPAISEERCTGAKKPENVAKNRYPDRIPPDFTRPYLMSNEENGGTNYINASFCNGYGKDNMYLTTQVPLPNTVDDFWCMMFDYECHTIVALNDPNQVDKTCGIYWPTEEGTITCGAFTIEAHRGDEKVVGNVIERTLKYYRTNRKGEVFKVKQIQYKEWPGKRELPKSPDSFLHLLETVETSRRDSGDERMAVVCMDGVTRCGLLCAVMSIIDKIKEEQLVDVFQAVKRLRASRYDMVHSLDQYKFCYEMARVYLRAFDTYSNFTS